ncbi:MAG: YbbR-like domain-containing protein, partial [Lachnospiraceae bacterium]
MKERVVNNLSLKLLSVGLAFIIWLAVVNISNPEVTRTKTVSLNVVNGDVLSNAGKAYEVQNGETVVVSYQVRTRDAYRITADDFRASIDLRDLYAVTGSVPVTVEVMRNKELISGTPTARPGVVRVLTEDIQNKSFSLTTATDGTPADGFEVGSMTLTPATVMVSGPVSQVGRISSAGVRVSVEGISDDQMGHADVTYYDANGNESSFAEGEISVEPKEI